MLHEGFWRAAFDRKLVGPMAAALAAEGYLVAAVAPGACDPGRLLLAGHSADGHLAL